MTSGTFIEAPLLDELDREAAREPQTPFAAVGGAKAVAAVVDEFYARLMRDEATAPYFARIITDGGMSSLKRHQVLMITQALGGPNRYAGRDLTSAHADLNISADDYRRVCLHLLTTMHDFHVPMDILGAVDSLLGSLRPQIVTASGGAAEGDQR